MFSHLRTRTAFALCLIGLCQCQVKKELPPGDPDNGGLFLPGDFEALVVADNIGPARHLAVNHNGDIYVKLRGSRSGAGRNVALRDTTFDGKADIVEIFGEQKRNEGYGTGMAIHQNYLYYSSARVVYRQKLTDGALVPNTKLEVILTDDHEHGVHWHITKPMSFDNQGNMFVPFGTPSNACQDIILTPAGVPGVPGLDPCPELEHHGGIWKFDAHKLGQTQKDGTLFSTGIRSVVAMDWNPVDENLYLVMHGRDDLHRMYPNLYSPWESAVLPSEEFLRVTEGSDFGWPYCYYDQIQEKKVLAPEYGGDGDTLGRCSDCDLPVMGFPGHWAPNDLYFYQGDQFPERYRNGAFIAFHGSTNRAPYPQAGYFIGFIPFVNGDPTGEWEVFADGFPGVDPIVSTGDAMFRPMGIAMGPDGSLYVSESRRGKIWRIMYKGEKEEFGIRQLAKMEEHKTLSHIRTPDKFDDHLQKETVVGGEKLFLAYCSPCHQRDGRGAPGRFPSLVASDWVGGDRDRLIGVVLNGLSGSIQVNGETYNGVMPPNNFLSDEEMASVLTYIRQNFGNDASEISSNEVGKVRSGLSNS